VEKFLREFDVASKTDVITQLLEENGKLKAMFSKLATTSDEHEEHVVVVTYAEFWTRYFYRIGGDETRLVETYRIYFNKNYVMQLQRQQQQLQQQQQQQQATLSTNMSGLSAGVSSFFGGVVDRLTTESDHTTNDGDRQHANDANSYVDESMDPQGNTRAGSSYERTDFPDVSVGPATQSALNFLSKVTNAVGNGGRPPFVMNTAVSDTDDEDYEDDNGNGRSGESDDGDESEEELGWDDDDDDYDVEDDDAADNKDDTDNGNGNDDEGETTVEFKDAEKETLLDELEQARAERDSLQKTVEMQTEELQSIMAASATATAPTPVVVDGELLGGTTADSDPGTTQRLQMQLFEKDSELAALRARLEDENQDDDTNNNKAAATATQQQQEEEISKLNILLVAKDNELNGLRTGIAQQRKEQHNNPNNDDSNHNQEEALQLVTSLHAAKVILLEEKETEIDLLRSQVESANSKLQKICDDQLQTTTEKEELHLLMQSEIDALQQEIVQHTSAQQQQQVQVHDGKGNDDTENNNELLRTLQIVADKDQEINALQTKLQELEIQSKEKASNEQEQDEELLQQFKSQIKSLQEDITILQDNAEQQDQYHQEQKQQSTTIQEGFQSERDSARTEHKELQSKVDANKHTIVALEQEVKRCQLSETEARNEAAAAKAAAEAAIAKAAAATAASLSSPPSPGSSNSTGVQVHAPGNSSSDDAAIPFATTTPLPEVATTTTTNNNAADLLGIDLSENNDGDNGDDDGWGDGW